MGAEFRVNTYEENWQDGPGILTFGNGSFLIVWRSFFSDNGTYYTGGQYFDAAGDFVGSEKVMDAVAGSASEPSSLRLLKGGGYAMSFAFSADGLLDQDRTYVKIFNANGTVRNDGVRVDSIAGAFQSGGGSIASHSDGGFTVFFAVDSSEHNSKIDFVDIFGQRFDKNGVKVGGNFRVNTKEHELDQRAVDVLPLANGNNLVYWHSVSSFNYPNGGFSNEFRASLYSSSGKLLKGDFSLGDSFGSTRSSLGAGDMAELPDGGFAFVRYEMVSGGKDDGDSILLLRKYDASGRITLNDVRVAQSDHGLIYGASIARLDSGELALVFERLAKTDSFNNQNNIYGRMIDVNGRKLSAEFLVSTAQGGEQESPVVESLAGGGFVVTYQSEAADADNEGIAARIFGRGTSAADTQTVDASGIYFGLAGDDNLTGNAGVNVLYGGTGDDELWGLGGNDKLSGGVGNDTFYFTAALNSLTNVDRITAFTPGADRMALSKAIFKALGKTVGASEFQLGERADDADDRLIYTKTSGKLYYDPDGAGSGKQVLFADLKDGTNLSFGDFLVV